jgi:dihydrofolate reductase
VEVTRAVVLYVAQSVDGYIARPDGAVDWLGDPDALGYEQFYRGVGAVIMGRETYEQVLTFGPFPYADKECFVVSSTRTGTAEFVRFVEIGALEALVGRLRSRAGGDIWLVGGAQLIRHFREGDLIDRYIIFTQPVLLGAGIPLFLEQPRERRLKLLGVTAFPSGGVEARYERSTP